MALGVEEETVETVLVLVRVLVDVDVEADVVVVVVDEETGAAPYLYKVRRLPPPQIY